MAEDLIALSRRAGAELLERGGRVCAAESCTGGLLLSTLTDCPGSSRYVAGGVVSYCDESKMRLLSVPEEVLIAHGAVSAETVIAMARGALALFEAEYALSVTGIAGPGGGTYKKPIGLTYIGVVGPAGLPRVERRVWDRDRMANKLASVEAALSLLIAALRD